MATKTAGPNGRARVVVLAFAFALINLAVLVFFLIKRNTVVAASLDTKEAFDGGAPFQRSRIDFFIAQVGDYSDFTSLAEGLNDQVLKGDDIVFVAGDIRRMLTRRRNSCECSQIAELPGCMECYDRCQQRKLSEEL